jgi:kynureninase
VIEPRRAVAASRSRQHSMSKPNDMHIRLLTRVGVDGDVRPGDAIRVALPAPPYRGLEPV